MESVWAVVVTHNRRESLGRCLDAVLRQERPPDRVLVVDNASTDGTSAFLAQSYAEAEVLTLPVNLGGAGGFHEGMKHAHAAGADWLWLMDDDTLPERSALTELLSVATSLDGAEPPWLLASKALWRDGSVHPMNFPVLERRRREPVIAGAARGVMPIRAATFVSLLVHRRAIDCYGLPRSHYFLWSDDIEYTSRVVLGGAGAYFVPASIVVHDTPRAEDFMAADPARFYYHVRNTVLTARGPGRPPRDRLARLWALASTSTAYLRQSKTAASVAAVARGIRDGLRMPP